jgi:hypothetical protein
MSLKTICFRQIAVVFLGGAFLICAASAFGQTADVESKLPETVRREIVRRVLVYSFKPRLKPTKVFLYEKGIKREWLPEIKNIEFNLVPENELEQRGNVYFFLEIYLFKGKYVIGFGFGQPKCNARYDEWAFRVSKQRVKLWKHGRDGGMGCATLYSS